MIFHFYRIAHFLSFFDFEVFICRPLVVAGPVSRIGFLNGRTIRINSQKT
jgi:hypothetical protein